MGDNTSTRPRLELRPIEVGVGAGAAVLTAFASSYLGTAGTLTGAALASVVGTVSTSVLRTSAQRTTESLHRTTSRLRQGRTGPEMGGSTRVDPGLAAVGPTDPVIGGAGAEPGSATDPTVPDGVGGGTDDTGADSGTGGIGSRAAGTGGTGTGAAAGGGGIGGIGGTGTGTGTGGAAAGGIGEVGGFGRSGEPGASGPWRPRWPVLAAGAVIAFVVALIAITGIESAVGKPLAALVGKDTGGGTTIGRTVGEDPAPTTDERGTPAPTPSGQPSGATTGTASPTGDASPTGEPSPSAAPGESSPAPAPSVTQPAETAPPTAAPSP